MKLRDKLKISFCVMIVLPVIMLCVFVVGIFKMQSDSICKTYNVEENRQRPNQRSLITEYI